MDLNEQLLEKARNCDQVACANLINAGAAVNAKDRHGLTPLMYAVLRGHVDLARMLLERGAQADVFDIHGRAPLHLAAFEGSTELFQLILSYGANIDAKDRAGKTPLILALENGSTKNCLNMLNLGADCSGVNAALSGEDCTHHLQECAAVVTAWLSKRRALDVVSVASIGKPLSSSPFQ